MTEQVKSEIVPGNIVFNFIKQHNNAVYSINKYYFNREGKPNPKSPSSEPLKALNYAEVARRLNAMSEEDKALFAQLKKDCWRIYFEAVADKYYPELERILGIRTEDLA